MIVLPHNVLNDRQKQYRLNYQEHFISFVNLTCV